MSMFAVCPRVLGCRTLSWSREVPLGSSPWQAIAGYFESCMQKPSIQVRRRSNPDKVLVLERWPRNRVTAVSKARDTHLGPIVLNPPCCSNPCHEDFPRICKFLGRDKQVFSTRPTCCCVYSDVFSTSQCCISNRLPEDKPKFWETPRFAPQILAAGPVLQRAPLRNFVEMCWFPRVC